ncbi:competence protein CoiA [Gracilibacillus dipsosauri]|uniref:competence protein CoiA n=1 Tax=Gracilibacillus dipsosauri TaxID=178340 RepID=UPI0024094D44
MLQAQNEKGEHISLYTCTIEEINQYKETTTFICPECGEKLIIKAGEKVIPHFAHRSNTTCSQGGEGAYHEKGKIDLFQRFRNQGIEVSLEQYLPEIKQRPDLLVQIENRQIPIEYQCAKISTNEMMKRTNAYRKNGYHPIWILGANRFHRLSSQTIKLTSNDQSYIHQFHSKFPLTIYFYCSTERQFILFQDFYFLTRTKAIGKLKTIPLEELGFRLLFQQMQLDMSILKSHWLNQRKKWRIRPVPIYESKETAWRQWLYLHQFTVQDLPSFIYLPVRSQFLMNSAPWIWQTRIFIDLMKKRSCFSLQEAIYLLQSHQINPSQFPLISSPNNPIAEYLQLLERIGILKAKTEDNYTVTIPSKHM